MAKTAQPKWLDNAEIIKRLHAARDIALTCHYGAQAAHIDFVNSESRKLARTDYAGLKRHVELWFSRWEAALRDFERLSQV